MAGTRTAVWGRDGVNWKAASIDQGKKREVPFEVSYSLPKYIRSLWVRVLLRKKFLS